MKCKHCNSDNVEKRGTRERRGEVYVRLVCRGCQKWSTAPFQYSNEESLPTNRITATSGSRWLVTSAQNNTPVDKKFWQSLVQYANFVDARILVIPVMYRNPSMPGEAAEEAWWPRETLPFLVSADLELVPGCRVMGNVKIAATSVNPLSGLEALSRGDSAIIGHAQIQLRTVATPQNKLPKILVTTGSVSQKSYSKSKAGIQAAFHHSLGCVIVEKDKDLFHIRSIVADDNSEFYDLDHHATPRGVKKSKRIEALVLGDEHVGFTSPEVKAATFTNDDSVVKALNPRYLVRHDLIDSYSISHHHNAQPDIRYKKSRVGTNSLEKELEATRLYLEETTPNGCTSVVVPSNHHNHIQRWLREVEWRNEPWNAKIYHELWNAWLHAIDQGLSYHPFTWWMKRHCKADAIYLQPDYPFIVKGIYMGYHGDKGINGAKGNLRQFSKIGVKTITAHWHSPGILQGAYLVGTSTTLNLEYTDGPSSWMNTHCIVHPNGKRQLVNIIKGRWRG